MRVIKPVNITDATLTDSTLTGPDAALGEIEWTAGTYTLGTRRVDSSTHKIYEVVADPSTSNSIPVGLAATVPTWVEIGPTNRWACFDQTNGTQAEAEEVIEFEFTIGAVTNSIAAFNVSGVTSVSVTMVDAIDGTVYENTIDMVDNSGVVDYYEYFFSPIIQRKQLAATDLPAYRNGVITIRFEGPTTVKVGAVIMGNALSLGVANHGTGLQLFDFSTKDLNDFGEYSITERGVSKLVDFDCTVLTTRVSYVFNTLSDLTTVPSAWMGTASTGDATLVYGYYRDSQINISGPVVSECTIQIEGLAI